MPILIHNNPQYIESLKAKRISDKLSREKPKCNTHKYKQPVYKGLVTKYIKSLKAKRISDKLSREEPVHKYKQPVYKGLVTKYNNGSNTMFSWNSRK